MKRSEFQDYHAREAARLRRLIANTTTSAVKAWLIEEAEEHERLADGLTCVRQETEPLADAS